MVEDVINVSEIFFVCPSTSSTQFIISFPFLFSSPVATGSGYALRSEGAAAQAARIINRAPPAPY